MAHITTLRDLTDDGHATQDARETGLILALGLISADEAMEVLLESQANRDREYEDPKPQ